MKAGFTQTQLRERGWTVTAIKRFLGEPDHVGGWNRTNTYYLYAETRVHAAEQTNEYREWQEKSAARRARSKETAERRRGQLMQSLADWEPDFTVADDITLDDVIDASIDDYNGHRGYASADRASDQHFLDRIAVNFLRHNVSNYDEMLRVLRGKVGVRDAEDLVRERIYEAIADRFPELSAECHHQLMRRLQAA